MIELGLIFVQIQRHENFASEALKLFFCSQIHLPRGAGPAYLQMMKRDCGLDHRLEKKFFIRRHRTHPTLFPGVVRRVKLSRVIQIDPGDELDRVSEEVLLSVMCCGGQRSHCSRCGPQYNLAKPIQSHAQFCEGAVNLVKSTRVIMAA